MKVSGFTFIRNAIKYDYPIEEAIRSILPLCDEVVVAVGRSEDDTLGLIRGINDAKIRIIETVWDDTLRVGGRVLAVETDKAFRQISPDADWALYIQGDEVLHEQDYPAIRAAMEKHLADPTIDGLLFSYRHFFGSYDYIGASSNWYRHEVRVVRNRPDIYANRDAQGFRKGHNQKLTVAPANAYVHHYGWVKDPRAMQRKQESFPKLWHPDSWIEKNVIPAEQFSYEKHITQIVPYTGTHPQVMAARIARLNWTFERSIAHSRTSLKDLFKRWMRRLFGIEIGFKNYILKRM